ncbi:MAG: hypothetical protein O6924_04550 [Alphaproteobacteria bacterium]|nr:hypothetical protein [Alphaproteobacteria bacterium]
MTGKRRGSPALASVLVSLALSAVVLGYLLDRHLRPAQPPAVKPQLTLAKGMLPSTPKLLGRGVGALRLPPPPKPLAPAKIKPPKRKTQPRRARALPQPPVAKPPAAKRARPEAPALVPRGPKAPTSQGLKPKARPTPRPKPKAALKSKPPLLAQADTVVPTRATRREGRTLLRLLEYGRGPTIEIAWPENQRTRDRLYRKFRECFGMRNAVMTPDGRLYGETGPRGVPWDINLDRYSGFVRHPAGRTIAAERARARDISARHGIHGRLVRVFPRNVDAVILGGLNQVIGGTYRGAKTITATYRKRRGRLVLGAIKVNGRPREGVVDISVVKRRGCLI